MMDNRDNTDKQARLTTDVGEARVPEVGAGETVRTAEVPEIAAVPEVPEMSEQGPSTTHVPRATQASKPSVSAAQEMTHAAFARTNPKPEGPQGKHGSAQRAIPLVGTAFVVVVFALLLIPSVGMLWARTDTTTENTTLAEAPLFTQEDGSWNTAFLADAGAYFEDHFAYRETLVSANDELYTSILATSPLEEVVFGTDGWLYYSGTLDDYLGRDVLTERGARDVAHNIALMQEFVEAQGARFVFTVAPNKSTLYAEHMPYFLLPGESSSLEMLEPYLDTYGVRYVSLIDILKVERLSSGSSGASEASEQPLYLKRDTHWNTLGARLGYNALLDACGKEHETYADATYYISDSYIGDINRILFPTTAEPEENYSFETTPFRYLTEATDIENDPWLVTGNAAAADTLLMFRDSFCNALFPFLAGEFERAFFSKLEPYNLANVTRYNPDYVIVERAERNIADLGTQVPIMEGMERELAAEMTETACDSNTTLKVGTDGSYLTFAGIVDGLAIDTDSSIYLRVYSADGSFAKIYEPFWTMTPDEEGTVSDYGYLLYLNADTLPKDGLRVDVLVSNGFLLTQVKSFTNVG